MKVLNGFKAIILDMDGVIVDSEPIHGESFRIFLDELDVAYSDQFISNLVGHSINHNIKTINETYLANRPLAIEEGVRMRDAIYLNLISNMPLKPLEGIESLILKCQQKNIRLGLATSSVREQIKVTLENISENSQYNIDFCNVFESIVGGDDVIRKKPAPDIYSKVIKKMGIDRKTCLAVEDSEAGIMSAKANGILCIALKNQYLKIHDNLPADILVNSIEEITNMI